MNTALAVDGGTPVRVEPIQTGVSLTEVDIEAAVRVLRSGRLGGPDHPEVSRFESLLAQSSGTMHAVAVSSGTAAIHCTLLALGVGPGDEVIVPAHTFIATATPVLMVGATPVIVDVDDKTYCIDPASVQSAANSRTRAVIAVHLNGHPAPIDLLPTGIPIVSDGCQAHGAALHGRPVGSLGVASTFSFWQDKIITSAGEGGAVVTDDDEIAESARLRRSHSQMPIPGTSDSHHVSLGFNYRLTGVQAAVGGCQMERLSAIVGIRQAMAKELSDHLAGIPGIGGPAVRDGATHVFWKYVINLDLGRFRVGRMEFAHALRAEGVPAVPRYPLPLTRQPVMQRGARMLPCPVADALADQLIVLPLPASTDDSRNLKDAEDIAEAVRKVAAAFRR